MARRSVILNGLEERVQIHEGDLRELHNTAGYGVYDAITVNPPYMPLNGSDLKLNSHQAMARHEIGCTLEEVIQACVRLVRTGGKVSMVHKPQRLVDIISLMRKHRLEPKLIRFVHPRAHLEANMVLIEAARDGKPEPEGCGCLYLVATPIGNLEDMTYRAVRMLKECDIIAAEDTRQTRKLLSHFEITPSMLFSYHEHNKAASGPELIRYIIEGKNLALVSDAGLPAISDPGADLVALAEAFGNRRVTLARELTKRYEEFVRGTIEECAAWLAEHPPLGEYVIVLEGESKEEAELAESSWWRELSIEDHVAHYEASDLSRKDAMKKAASDRGLAKRDIYNALLERE
ncbi:hypothetical protein KC345_g7578 [Hortaea werneckii]|nr:hypothetical protein KC345_g7578 [Hortaea werneckii]